MSGGQLATFADFEEWLTATSPLFDMRQREGWAQEVWVGGRGTGWGGQLTWSGSGFEQVDGTPFPFNWGRMSGRSPWLGRWPYYDDVMECLKVNVYDSHSNMEEAHVLESSGCKNYHWFLCKN
jgi:hypothetical protein